MDTTARSRRDFIAHSLALGSCALPLATAAAAAVGTDADAITPKTIEEAEKLHALHFSAAQREALAVAAPAQVAGIESLRRLAISRWRRRPTGVSSAGS